MYLSEWLHIYLCQQELAKVRLTLCRYIQIISCIASIRKKCGIYDSMEWNMEENFRMEWKIFSKDWKKIAIMECGKIVFHIMPCLPVPWICKG